MNHINYEYLLQDLKKIYSILDDCPEDSDLNEFVILQAKIEHKLIIHNELYNWVIKIPILAQKLKNEDAKFYMQYGAGRRLSMIFYAYMRISQTADPKRTKPLSNNERDELSVDINIIYINIRGTLDNFAWSILYEKFPNLIEEIRNDQKGALKKQNINLMSKEFRKKLELDNMTEKYFVQQDDWFKNLSEKRDPVAHRIPLYIPTSIINSNDKEIYQNLFEQHMRYINGLDFENAEAISQEMQEMGTFGQVFAHHPNEPFIPLYPTIPTDIGHILSVGNIVEKILLDT